MKGVRNNLLTKNLLINKNEKTNGNKKFASWDDIVIAYEMDKFSLLKRRNMPRLTDKHVYPVIIPKMRVKYCTQVFSSTVSNFIDVVLTWMGGKYYISKQ